MPYTMEDYRRDVAREHLHELTPEERLAGLSAKEIVECLSPEEILSGLPIDQVKAYLNHLLANKKAKTPTKKGKRGA